MSRVKKVSIDLMAIFILLICTVFLCQKARTGYIFNDEPFMITLGHRILKGDRFFIDEYNSAQLTGLFYVPFVWLFTAVTKSTTGMILFLRYVYVAWQVFVSVILYLRLKQYGWISIICVLFYVLFTPLDEMSLTYNVMASSCILLFDTYFLVKGNHIKDYLAGVCLSVAVIAYPYLIFLYFIWALSVILINSVFKKRFTTSYNVFDWKKFLRISSVCAVGATILLAAVFSRGFNDVFASLKRILQTGSSNNSVIDLFREMGSIFRLILAFVFVIGVVSSIDRNREKRARFYFFAQSLLWLVAMIILIRKNFWSFNVIMFPVSLLGLQAFILTKKKNWQLLIIFGVTAAVYSYVALVSSDTIWFAFSTGTVPLGLVSFVMILDLYQEIDKSKIAVKWASGFILFAIIMVQLCGQGYIRLNRNYWDETGFVLSSKIKVGSAKGICTSAGYKASYESVYGDLTRIMELTGENKKTKFLSLSLFPSVYLDLDYEYGTCSSWTYYQNRKNFPEMNRKLNQYYASHPEKIPDCIYILNDDIELLGQLDFVNFSDYKQIDLETGRVYIKK